MAVDPALEALTAGLEREAIRAWLEDPVTLERLEAVLDLHRVRVKGPPLTVGNVMPDGAAVGTPVGSHPDHDQRGKLAAYDAARLLLWLLAERVL